MHSPAHQTNIVVHALAGSVALLTGLVAILSPKRLGWHTSAGIAFVRSYWVVVVTAAIGLLVFEFRSFLAVVTILSLYDVFAGMRALTLRGKRPQRVDLLFSVVAVLAPAIFLSLMRHLHLPWVPVLTWPILGGLIAIGGYDLCRLLLPLDWLRRTWVQEHLVKMMGGYIAITSAFAGTVFQRWMPWAAVVPSVAGLAVELGFLLVGPRAWRRARPRREADAPKGMLEGVG